MDLPRAEFRTIATLTRGTDKNENSGRGRKWGPFLTGLPSKGKRRKGRDLEQPSLITGPPTLMANAHRHRQTVLGAAA